MLHLQLTQAEAAFLLNLVLQRPMSEVEALVFKMRQQLASQVPPPARPESADEPAKAGGTD